VWCGGADGGIKGNIAGVAVGRAGLDVPPALAVGAGAATAPPLPPRQAIKGGVDAARELEFGCRFDLLAAFPPLCILALEDVLPGRVCRWGFRGFSGVAAILVS
jgi:hypothetical protein